MFILPPKVYLPQLIKACAACLNPPHNIMVNTRSCKRFNVNRFQALIHYSEELTIDWIFDDVISLKAAVRLTVSVNRCVTSHNSRKTADTEVPKIAALVKIQQTLQPTFSFQSAFLLSPSFRSTFLSPLNSAPRDVFALPVHAFISELIWNEWVVYGQSVCLFWRGWTDSW